MVTAVIFDLDMCILDTHSLTGDFFEPVLSPLRASSLSDDMKSKILRELWTTSLDDVVEMFSIPEVVAESMREAYRAIIVPDTLQTFGDEAYIKDVPAEKILVTSGYRNFQQSKIDKLGIAQLFDHIIIDELDDRKIRKGKKKIFLELVETRGWNANAIVVVGDNPFSELEAGRSLGMTTVQTVRPGIEPWEAADYRISSFKELLPILRTVSA